jgi:hypothetical protein
MSPRGKGVALLFVGRTLSKGCSALTSCFLGAPLSPLQEVALQQGIGIVLEVVGMEASPALKDAVRKPLPPADG